MKKFLLIASLLMVAMTAQAWPFVTTPNPSTYPIHWYKLRIAGYYLCSTSWGDLSATQSSSSSDDYLWCFLEDSNTGKIVIYNKALQQSMSDGWEFTPYLFSQSTNWVEQGSGNNFYICANMPGSTAYMACDEGSISFTPKSVADPITATQALVEDYIDSGETIVFSDLEVNDDNCSFYFTTDNHQYACEYILYVNGQRVGMPYVIQRTNEVQTVEAEAHVVYSNPRIRELVAYKTYEIPALGDDPGPVTGLNAAMNVAGGNINFLSGGAYPWIVAEDGDRVYGMSGNKGVDSSTSTVTATVNLDKPSTLSFEFKAWGEGTSTPWDKCALAVDGTEELIHGGYQNDWEFYSIDLPAGTHTLTWSYTKDDSGHPLGDYFAVDNVKIVPIEIITEMTLTPYNVYTPNNVQTDPAEDYYKLFDKDRSTKWCVDNSTGSWETIWVDFKSNLPFRPTSYTMTTGNDTQSWSGRNPKKWKIYAKANQNDSWTTIVNVTDGDAEGLGTNNTTDYSFDIDGVNTNYQYFRFEVSEVRDKGGWQNDHYVFQLAELALSGYESTVVPGDVNGDGNVTAADVTAIYNWLLNNDNSAIVNGDQNGDGNITAADVTSVYNILLGN